MTCSDYNLAEFINDPNPEERKFKEIMRLRKIDQTSIFVRKTENGKFNGPDWRASYCPEEQQRIENGKALEPWLPREGIYASPGDKL
jgi:hypothetical protein